jgi:hypothetical protein
MALPFVVALTALIYLKPQEFVPLLTAVPTLYIVFTLAIAGVVFDVGRGALSARLPPQAPWVLAFAGWALVDITLRDRTSIPRWFATIGIGVGIYLAVALAVGTASRARTFAALLLGLGMTLAVIGAHQSLQPFVCFRVDDAGGGRDEPVYDGHPCENWSECEKEAGTEMVDWLCERPGMLGTSSIGHGRVRYRGSLADPNELALVIGSALPFAFALGESKKSKARLLAVASMLVVAGWAIVRTESRGGQIVFAAVIGLFFIRRFRLWGAIVGCLAVLPVMLLGGRSGAEADASAMERIEAWYEGINMFKGHPILGVGPGLFTDHHYITAHNAYVLVMAETGIVGLFLWGLSVYASVKIPAKLWWEGDARLDARLRTLAPALLVAFVGLLIGIFFLSFAYHQVLYLFMGLSGALALAARRSVPDFDVRISAKEMAWMAVGCVGFVLFMFAYTRVRMR